MPQSTEEFVRQVRLLDYMRRLAAAKSDPERKQEETDLLAAEERSWNAAASALLFD